MVAGGACTDLEKVENVQNIVAVGLNWSGEEEEEEEEALFGCAKDCPGKRPCVLFRERAAGQGRCIVKSRSLYYMCHFVLLFFLSCAMISMMGR